jgi:hypothetical protein
MVPAKLWKVVIVLPNEKAELNLDGIMRACNQVRKGMGWSRWRRRSGGGRNGGSLLAG